MCETRANYHYKNIPANIKSVKVLTVSALQYRGYGMEIREAYPNLLGDVPEDHYGIYYERSIDGFIWESLFKTPEFQALENALKIAFVYPLPENEKSNREEFMIDKCIWDERTRRKLEGLFWLVNRDIWIADAKSWHPKPHLTTALPFTSKKLTIGLGSPFYKDSLKRADYCAETAKRVLQGEEPTTLEEYPNLIHLALDARLPGIETSYPY
jgi:hypothetical protein